MAQAPIGGVLSLTRVPLHGTGAARRVGENVGFEIVADIRRSRVAVDPPLGAFSGLERVLELKAKCFELSFVTSDHGLHHGIGQHLDRRGPRRGLTDSELIRRDRLRSDRWWARSYPHHGR
jgi:hypothetical protein